MLGFFQSLGVTELLIILAVILILFGASRVPALARSLGKSVHEFKKGIKDVGDVTADKEDTPEIKSEQDKNK